MRNMVGMNILRVLVNATGWVLRVIQFMKKYGVIQLINDDEESEILVKLGFGLRLKRCGNSIARGWAFIGFKF